MNAVNANEQSAHTIELCSSKWSTVSLLFLRVALIHDYLCSHKIICPSIVLFSAVLSFCKAALTEIEVSCCHIFVFLLGMWKVHMVYCASTIKKNYISFNFYPFLSKKISPTPLPPASPNSSITTTRTKFKSPLP